MVKDFFIEYIKKDCPICDEVHEIEYRKRIKNSIVKKEIVEYEEFYYKCTRVDEDENEFVSAKLMDDNLLRARDAYRKKMNLLTSQEIIEIRNLYHLTQSELSLLLGWGEVTVSRYETKLIQDETYDVLLQMIKNEPVFALKCLEKHKNNFSNDKYVKIRNNIKEKIELIGNESLKIQEIMNVYLKYEEKNDLNGYKCLDLNKVQSVIAFFASQMSHLYKVKLMKLLWYTDALFYKRYHTSMTGLVYKHMPLGALPLCHDEILQLPSVNVEEVIYKGDLSYKITPNTHVLINQFTNDEYSVLNKVCIYFKDFTSKEIIEYMHQEKAYKETEPYHIITYHLAEYINDLN